jgi:hypothetical protein
MSSHDLERVHGDPTNQEETTRKTATSVTNWTDKLLSLKTDKTELSTVQHLKHYHILIIATVATTEGVI